MRRKVSSLTTFFWTLNLSVLAMNLLMDFVAKDRFLNGIFGSKRNRIL